MMKAETIHACFPSVNSFHSLPFKRVLYSSPDDTPPLSKFMSLYQTNFRY